MASQSDAAMLRAELLNAAANRRRAAVSVVHVGVLRPLQLSSNNIFM